MFMENNLRESDRRCGGFLEKEERDRSMGLGFFIWRMKVVWFWVGVIVSSHVRSHGFLLFLFFFFLQDILVPINYWHVIIIIIIYKSKKIFSFYQHSDCKPCATVLATDNPLLIFNILIYFLATNFLLLNPLLILKN